MKSLINLIIASLFIVLCGCSEPKQELIYKKAEILDIKRDDDGELHLLIRYDNENTILIHDLYEYDLKTGNYGCEAELPYKIYYEGDSITKETEGWTNDGWGKPDKIKIYLPSDYKIELFDD